MRWNCTGLLFVSLLSFSAWAQQREPALSPPDADRVSIIRAHYQSQAELQAIASQFQHIIVNPR